MNRSFAVPDPSGIGDPGLRAILEQYAQAIRALSQQGTGVELDSGAVQFSPFCDRIEVADGHLRVYGRRVEIRAGQRPYVSSPQLLASVKLPAAGGDTINVTQGGEGGGTAVLIPHSHQGPEDGGYLSDSAGGM